MFGKSNTAQKNTRHLNFFPSISSLSCFFLLMLVLCTNPEELCILVVLFQRYIVVVIVSGFEIKDVEFNILYKH